MISLIVAVAKNSAIGKDNRLLWHLGDDLKRFKRITSGHPVIMGKKTWESLPVKPLPGRKNIILTDEASDSFPGGTAVFSMKEALELCDEKEESFVIGGASVYRQFLPFAGRLYVTRVHKDFEGDVFFPEINEKEWRLVSKEDCQPDNTIGFSWSYLVYEKIPS